jgi:hypothetical protein
LSDEVPDPEILAAIAEALEALNESHPALILEITAAIHAPWGAGARKSLA